MPPLQQALDRMTKAQRDMPVTRGELVLMLGKVAEHMKALKHRNDALEQRLRQIEARL